MDIKKIIHGYEIIKKLGKGASGVVYLAKKENKFYALKKIFEPTNEEIKAIQNILNILYNINNEYVIKYYESFIENEFFYIIMEYGGDLNLKQFIGKYKEKNEYLNEIIIKDIIMQICLGLNDIHKNKLIHRDLTPDNIFINKNNKIKIGDFGISKILTINQNYAKTQIGKFSTRN